MVRGASVADAQPRVGHSRTVVVANRVSGNISVIDPRTDQVVRTVALPMGANAPEPMYVVVSRAASRVLVGDRANDRVVAFDARTFSVVGAAAAGGGVFHMWEGGSGRHRQLWVNNDVDNTTSVIDARTLQSITTINTPNDIVAAGGKPHDVFVPDNGRDAWVSYVGLAGANDVVVRYDRRTFAETGRVVVGKDPHLWVAGRHLYIPTQQANEVRVVDRRSLAVATTIAVPAAHGVYGTHRFVYVTNIAGGGTDGIQTIDRRTNAVIGTTNTPFPTPHNIVVVRHGRASSKAYVTHSGGTADQTSIFRIDRNSGLPTAIGSVQVGTNPFGLGARR